MELIQRVAPPAPARPQGGGRRRAGDREVPALIMFAATTGCAWRQVPPAFGASSQTISPPWSPTCSKAKPRPWPTS
ncbi:transposase [Actinomadura sp. LCR2-06]|uniref:Transposase n=1 Tax=Actinomadura violacea TaxID=2819934 RepID=A0ABS3RN53_9ACTN|nr:transposase [Actinomadura violacea]